jgi:hypothetical protein
MVRHAPSVGDYADTSPAKRGRGIVTTNGVKLVQRR